MTAMVRGYIILRMPMRAGNVLADRLPLREFLLVLEVEGELGESFIHPLDDVESALLEDADHEGILGKDIGEQFFDPVLERGLGELLEQGRADAPGLDVVLNNKGYLRRISIRRQEPASPRPGSAPRLRPRR